MESKRIKVQHKNPNPLFKQWLREWIEEAKSKKKKISKTYEKALTSLNKYPLTLYSGYDCAILENFGEKICKMLDDKLEEYLTTENNNLNQPYKERLRALQKRDELEFSEMVRSIEAACLTDNTFATTKLDFIDEDCEIENIPISPDATTSRHRGEPYRDVLSPDISDHEELLNLSPEDSFDRLARKYDEANHLKNSKNVIKRQKKQHVSTQAFINLLESPISYRPAQSSDSPTSAGGVRLKKFRTFNNGKSDLKGPSHASSPISKFLDVALNQNLPVSPTAALPHEDEFDRLAAKYSCLSPIYSINKAKMPVKQPISKVVTTSGSLPPDTPTDSSPADKFDYISIDDIKPSEYEVILLVDIQETSGYSATRVAARKFGFNNSLPF